MQRAKGRSANEHEELIEKKKMDLVSPDLVYQYDLEETLAILKKSALQLGP